MTQKEFSLDIEAGFLLLLLWFFCYSHNSIYGNNSIYCQEHLFTLGTKKGGSLFKTRGMLLLATYLKEKLLLSTMIQFTITLTTVSLSRFWP